MRKQILLLMAMCSPGLVAIAENRSSATALRAFDGRCLSFPRVITGTNIGLFHLAGNTSVHPASTYNLAGFFFYGTCSDSIAPDPKDVSSMDAILSALYDVISGPAGQKRNWDRMRTLFIPEARLIPTGKRADGSSGRKVMSLEDYIASSGPVLEKMGFFENEVHRKVDSFGAVVHVFSTYESRKLKEDQNPFMRGINSIQLWNDGKRWWVVTIFWQNETPELLIPAKYL